MGKRYTIYPVKNYSGNIVHAVKAAVENHRSDSITLMGPGCSSGGRVSLGTIVKVVKGGIKSPYKIMHNNTYRFGNANLDKLYKTPYDGILALCEICITKDKWEFDEVFKQSAIRVLTV